MAINAPFGSATARTLVDVFGSLMSWKGGDVEETRLNRQSVDTFEAVAGHLEETCSPAPDDQWMVRIVLAPLLAQLISCRVKSRRRNGGPPGAEVKPSSLQPGDLYVVEYVGDRVAHLKLALWPHGDDVWTYTGR